MAENFQRHRQPWTRRKSRSFTCWPARDEPGAIAKAMTRSEESVQARAKADKLKITKLR